MLGKCVNARQNESKIYPESATVRIEYGPETSRNAPPPSRMMTGARTPEPLQGCQRAGAT